MLRLRTYLVRIRDIPVGSLLDVIEALASHIMTRAYLKPNQSVSCVWERYFKAHLVDSLENGPLIVIPSSIQQTPHIPVSVIPTKRHEGFNLSSNEQPSLLHSPEERLDTVTISDGNEELLSLVKQHTTEFATQVMHRVEPVIAVQCDDKFTVTAGAELIIGLCEKVGTDLIVVVELAIDDGVDRVVSRVERLSPIG